MNLRPKSSKNIIVMNSERKGQNDEEPPKEKGTHRRPSTAAESKDGAREFNKIFQYIWKLTSLTVFQQYAYPFVQYCFLEKIL